MQDEAYKTNGRMQTYQLTHAEAQYLRRFRRMQESAGAQRFPIALMVIFEGDTVSYFNGNPSGLDKLTSK